MIRKIRNPWTGLQGYNCIGCSPTNPLGFHLCFYEEGDYVLTTWHPTPDHQGWINTLHGGVQSLLIDEVGPITIRAKVAKQMRNIVFIDAQLLNAQNEVCTEASLVYFCASKEKAFEQTGFTVCELEEE